MALGLPCCQSSRIGQGGRYFEMMRAVCPVSVNAMISLPQCTHCVPAPRGWDQPTKAARIEDSHDSHLLSYSYLTFMKIQLVPRGNVIPIGDVPGRLIVLRSRSPKNYATVQSDRLRFIAFHTQDIRPSWAIMGIMTYHGHPLSGWDAIRIYDRLHGGGTHRLDLIIMESWEKWDINGYHRKVMESDKFENPALDDTWWLHCRSLVCTTFLGPNTNMLC